MAKKNSKIIKEAYGEYEVLIGDAEVKRLAEIRHMSYLEEQSALYTVRIEGKKEEKIHIAKKLLKANMSIEQIIEITDLTKQEIQEIKNVLKDK